MKPLRGRPVWTLTAAGATFAATLYVTAVRHLRTPTHQVPVAVLVLLFALAEMAAVQVDGRPQAHTSSLAEVPLVLGLIATSPTRLIGAQMLGSIAALAVYRRQPALTVAYTLTALAIGTEIALLILHGVANEDDLLAGTTIAAVIVAALAASLLRTISARTFVAATEEPPGAEQVRAVSFGLSATAVTTTTVLVGVILHQTDPAATWLLALPIAGVYLAERAVASQMRERRRLEFLHESTSTMGGLDTADAVTSLLRQICHTFQSDIAALTYLPAGIPDSVALAVMGPAGAEWPMAVLPRREHWDAWSDLVPGQTARIVSGPAEAKLLGALLRSRTIRDAMVVPVCADLDVLGYLTVANRTADSGSFSPGELEVLETLVRFVSMGLGSGQLEQSLHEVRFVERQLVHRATHDPLTALGNRALVADHLEKRLDQQSATNVAVLLIHLRDLDVLPTTSGEMLVIAAQRLVRCLREGDLAARVGETELAVVAHVADDGGFEASRLGSRVVECLSRGGCVNGTAVEVTPRVAIVLGQSTDDVTRILRGVDMAESVARSAVGSPVAIVDR